MVGLFGLRDSRKAPARRSSPSSPPYRRKLLFEALEPRILLSADLNPAHEALLDAAVAPLMRVVEPQQPSYILSSQTDQPRQIVQVDSTIATYAEQIFFVDLDGANDVDYDGPVKVDDIDVRPFAAPGALAGQEAEVAAAMVAKLNAEFGRLGITFTDQAPAAGEYSTIHVGGDGSEFAQWGLYYGLAEKTDHGNQDKSDDAFVFSENISGAGMTAGQYGETLAMYAAHEAGHLLG